MDVVQQFIIERLYKIKNVIKDINLTYIYERGIDYHTIFVEPNEVYRNNDRFHELESSLVWDFYNKFPEHDILVTEVVPHIKIDNIIIRLESSRLRLKSVGQFTYTPDFSQNSGYYDFSLAA